MTWTQDVDTAILAGSRAYPKPEGYVPDYGTAGFRADAKLLASTIFRCGLLMAIRSLKRKETTGICITASHNPERDNGVKLSEPTGEMLSQSWEPYANALARAEDGDALAITVRQIMTEEGAVLVAPGAVRPRVLLARDTRASGPGLLAAAIAGVEALGCEPIDRGILTTPQLHWAVSRDARGLPSSAEAYTAELSGAFEDLIKPHPGAACQAPLYLDCANGVGSKAISAFVPTLQHAGLPLILFNTGKGELNGACGADAVQKSRSAPRESDIVPVRARAASLDGDADRVVYWFKTGPSATGSGHTDSIRLLDGDKIATLSAILVARYARELPPSVSARVGVVQTAYANGASSDYLRNNLGLEVLVTPTGVKHLHAAAHAFDVGIYFEANGHGTVLFSHDLLVSLNATARESPAASALLALSRAVNQTVGDAISGVLLVEIALRVLGWSVDDWDALYKDLPSRQLVVRVPDRTLVKTVDAERRVASPAALQVAIDAAVSRYSRGRAFIRPSGTEDVVRVYAEADSAAGADELARTIAVNVTKSLGPAT